MSCVYCHSLWISFIEQIFERHQLVALAAVGVHVVVDGNVADAEHRKSLLDVQPGVKLISAQTGQVLRDDDTNLSVFHVGHHLLETWALKICPAVSVIDVKTGIREVVVSGIPLQDHFLILNAV